MDRDNLNDVQRVQNKTSGGKAKVMLFGEFSGEKRAEEVDDPYYVRGLKTRFCNRLLAHHVIRAVVMDLKLPMNSAPDSLRTS
jgi:hypothetical protein